MKNEEASQLDTISSAGSALSPQARTLVAQSLRPNTRRAYAVQILGWLKWRGLSHLEPSNPIDVANYLAHLFATGRSLSTLRMIVAALKAAHAALGWRFEAGDPVISHVLRGAANATCALSRQAEPLRGAALLDILRSIATGTPNLLAKRDAAVLAVGYVFALRRSELVGLDLESQVFGDEKSCGVLRLRRTTIEVVLARTKTSKGIPEFVSVPRENNAEAVTAIEGWVLAAAIEGCQPLFRSLTKGGKLKGRLSAQAVSAIVKSRVRQHRIRPQRELGWASVSVDSDRYSGHSLRVGFAVSAAEAGADLRSIATITRHRSLVMPARYAEQADRFRTSPHRLEGVGLEEKK